MNRLAAAFAVARVYVYVVGGARLEIAHRKRRYFARLIVDRRARLWRRTAGSHLTIYLYRELLRQTAVEPLYALHV